VALTVRGMSERAGRLYFRLPRTGKSRRLPASAPETSKNSMSETTDSAKAWKIAIALAVFMMINFFDKVMLGLVAVPMMDELELTPQQFGAIGSSFFWLFAIGGVAGGFLANRFPTRLLVLCMIVIWSVCQLPIAFAASITTIIACRLVLGVGEGPAWPVAVHALYKWFPDSKRNLPIALLAQGTSIGLIVAGFLIPVITLHWGWRANFVVLAGAGFIWAVVWACLAEEGTIEQDRSAGPATVTASSVAYSRLLFDRTVLGCVITHFVGYWSLALGLTWLPAYFQRGLGYDGIISGRIYALVIVLTIPLGIGLAWWSQVLLRKGMSSKAARGRYLSCFLMLAGILFAAVYVSAAPDWIKIGILAFAIGLTPIIYSLGPAILAEVVPPPQRGAMLAINNSIAAMAGTAAPVVTGALIQGIPGAAGYETGFALCGGIMLFGGLLGFWMIDPAYSLRSLRPVATP
jgi:MFS family permease